MKEDNTTIENEQKIGDIGNFYGGLWVRVTTKGEFQWSMENYNGFYWKDIPESLYQALVKYEHDYEKSHE